MTAAALIQSLRARGVALRTDGQRIGVRPADAVTAEEYAALARLKADVLRVLAQPAAAPIPLDTVTLHEVLGRDAANPEAIASVQHEVAHALREIEIGIQVGVLPPRRVVRGRPLCDWLSLDVVARLLRDGARR